MGLFLYVLWYNRITAEGYSIFLPLVEVDSLNSPILNTPIPSIN